MFQEIPPENAVVVAVKAEREISKSALQWALAHVVCPGDFVVLLAVVPSETKGRRWKLWGFPKFAGDCSSSNMGKKFPRDRNRCEFTAASCSKMALQFHGPGDQNEVNMRIKVLMSPDGSPTKEGAVAAESKRIGANWIVLDRQLKQEARRCMDEGLHCNIVLMNRNNAKVLRLNLGVIQHRPITITPSPPVVSDNDHLPLSPPETEDRLKHSTPISSPEQHRVEEVKELRCRKASAVVECRESSSSSSNSAVSPFYKTKLFNSEDRGAGFILGRSSPSSSLLYNYNYNKAHNKYQWFTQQSHRYQEETPFDVDTGGTRTLLEKFAESDQQPLKCRADDSVRDVTEITPIRTYHSIPPPLCSICRHKTPIFGKPPKSFTLEELEDATDRFSDETFLAEGGYGLVHRGVLGDGQVVIVKKLKFVGGLKGDHEEDFITEVEVLSRAQHRNVVLLIGFCVEKHERFLVYEYICNGSLDFHLHGGLRVRSLDWRRRSQIAIGVARGLRYLHEDCRVGFVHGDVRPNNILLTHDFEPLVGDFGLARLQSEGVVLSSSETRVVGTFGYLASEYIETGVMTEKADVYTFGVVLLELLTGRRAMDRSHPKGQQFLAEWARPMMKTEPKENWTVRIDRYLDPRLNVEEIRLFAHQLNAMAHAASLCLRRDPLSRPTMSKILRILEGDDETGTSFSFSSSSPGTATMLPHVASPIPRKNAGTKGSHSMRFSRQNVSNAAVYTNHADHHVF